MRERAAERESRAFIEKRTEETANAATTAPTRA